MNTSGFFMPTGQNWYVSARLPWRDLKGLGILTTKCKAVALLAWSKALSLAAGFYLLVASHKSCTAGSTEQITKGIENDGTNRQAQPK